MKKYTVYNTTTEEILPPQNRKWPHQDGVTLPSDLPAEIVFLEEVIEADPPFDPETHRVQFTGEWAFDVTAKTATRTKELVALPPKPQREIDRDAMAASWKQLPEWLRGSFHAHYKAADDLLNESEDAAALALVVDADPTEATKADPARLATFEAVKLQFAASIQQLIDNAPVDPS